MNKSIYKYYFLIFLLLRFLGVVYVAQNVARILTLTNGKGIAKRKEQR